VSGFQKLSQSIIKNRLLYFIFIGIFSLSGCVFSEENPKEQTISPVPINTGDLQVVEVLEPIRQKYGVPAIAGAIVTVDGLKTSGVVGVRKIGTAIQATIDDQWHLGSDTKAMTAVLIARLVERKLMRWDMTVAEVFPDLTIHPDAQAITITHLVTHRAGLPANLLWGFISMTGSLQEQRMMAVRQGLAAKPRNPIGSVYEYSNLGYVIAGAMIEKITKSTWEKEIQKEIFDPLGMKSAGFGGVGTPGKIDQPWGHTKKDKPVGNNGPKADNPQVIGPAGVVHCTIEDWAKFIADQLRGEAGMKALLPKESYVFLHSPPFEGEYAYGWLVAQREWGGGTVITHAGCNTMNYAVAWLAPKRGFAVLVCINQGDDEAAKACDEAAGKLIELFNRK
jgi:CubicO group peptidase (beta-lactamase class C family)